MKVTNIAGCICAGCTLMSIFIFHRYFFIAAIIALVVALISNEVRRQKNA